MESPATVVGCRLSRCPCASECLKPIGFHAHVWPRPLLRSTTRRWNLVRAVFVALPLLSLPLVCVCLFVCLCGAGCMYARVFDSQRIKLAKFTYSFDMAVTTLPLASLQ